jgi:hypothetical protein
MTDHFFCADYSRTIGEQLFGTATRADVWLVLEYAGEWSAEVFRDSTIPQPVKDHISAALAAIPKSRLELIKQRGIPTRAISFYVAVSREQSPALYKFDLTSYEDLLTMDIPAIVAGNMQSALSSDPLFLVCTNGKRDRACAKFGVPVYDALTRYAGESVWQCSHVGGHRFAGNVVCLPHGISYGWVDPAQAESIISDYRQQQIQLDAYRGRSCYAEPVQAADYFLRAQTGVHGFADYQFKDAQRVDEHNWLVHFAEHSGTIREVQLIEELSAFEIYKNSAEDEKSRVPQYRLLAAK